MRIDTFMVGGGLAVLALVAMPFNSNPLVVEILFSAVLAGLTLMALDRWLDRLVIRFLIWAGVRAERRATSRKKSGLKEKTA